MWIVRYCIHLFRSNNGDISRFFSWTNHAKVSKKFRDKRILAGFDLSNQPIKSSLYGQLAIYQHRIRNRYVVGSNFISIDTYDLPALRFRTLEIRTYSIMTRVFITTLVAPLLRACPRCRRDRSAFFAFVLRRERVSRVIKHAITRNSSSQVRNWTSTGWKSRVYRDTRR